MTTLGDIRKRQSSDSRTLLDRAKPIKIKASRGLPSRKPGTKDWNLAVFLGDPQIGYRLFPDGELDPFHDEAAISAALNFMAYLEATFGIDTVVNLGDFLDLAPNGRFFQEATYNGTQNASIQYGHNFLMRQRAACPNARIVLVEGNHDARMGKYQQVFAPANAGLLRAGIETQSWPPASVPYLLNVEAADVEYIDAYPAGEFWVNRRLRAIHGSKVRSNGSTASGYINDNPHISTIFGHVHRLEAQYKTLHDHASRGPQRSLAASPGCLCRIDGAVPSYGSGIHHDGRPAVRYENWQHGIGLAWYKNTKIDQRFFYENCLILDGTIVYDGKEF